MITVRTMGGIGNQCFQFAFGLEVATRLGVDWRIDCGPGNDLNTYRPFNLGLFDIRVPVHEYVSREPIIKERFINYDENVFRAIKNGDTLYGYWQSEKYFWNVRHLVRERFKSVKPWPVHALEFANLIKDADHRSVMIGVRRDDYVNKPQHAEFHGTMPKNYYLRGIEAVHSHIKQDPVLFVFTDDPEWVKSNWNFGFKTHYFIGDRTVPGHMGREDVDLGLMALCNSSIISNGTFHWWGAWLKTNMYGLTICPERWFLDQLAYEQSKDICPSEWIRV